MFKRQDPQYLKFFVYTQITIPILCLYDAISAKLKEGWRINKILNFHKTYVIRYTAPDVLRRGMQTSLDLSVDLTNLVDGPTTIPEEIDPPDLPQERFIFPFVLFCH